MVGDPTPCDRRVTSRYDLAIEMEVGRVVLMKKHFHRFPVWMMPAALLLLAGPYSVADRALPEPVFPGERWQRHVSPEAAGFSSEKLAKVREATEELDTAAMMIVFRGRVVDAWGDPVKKYNCHSIRKSFLSALYGIQTALGKIDLDATMADLGIDDNDPLSETEKQATVRMLLKSRSGIYHPALYETAAMAAARPERHSREPGTYYYYNNWDFNALGTIYEQKTGEKIFESFGKWIADPIGMEDFEPEDGRYVTGRASRHAAYPLNMSARDMARFGLLFLNDGIWENRRVLPRGWVGESVHPHSRGGRAGRNGGYGYMWWVAVDGRHFAGVDNVPEGTYTGRGAGGHVLAVVPKHELVVVHRVDTFERGNRVPYGEVGRLLMMIIDARETGAGAD